MKLQEKKLFKNGVGWGWKERTLKNAFVRVINPIKYFATRGGRTKKKTCVSYRERCAARWKRHLPPAVLRQLPREMGKVRKSGYFISFIASVPVFTLFMKSFHFTQWLTIWTLGHRVYVHINCLDSRYVHE